MTGYQAVTVTIAVIHLAIGIAILSLVSGAAGNAIRTAPGGPGYQLG